MPPNFFQLNVFPRRCRDGRPRPVPRVRPPRKKKTFPHEPISRRPIPALANARQRLDPQAVDPILKQVALQHLNYLEGTYYEKREF
ncbi:MAG: hypothetical protein Q6370_013130 [Candidatus Sigynarchaeota archaeon]